jgi:hypothetical protein
VVIKSRSNWYSTRKYSAFSGYRSRPAKMRAGSAAKLIVDALLLRFLPLARRRIDTAQAQDGQYLRASDPAYEQVLDSLAMVAHHTPVPLLEALLKWRER